MFAVAAYDSDGRLIGGNIGKSTMPIIASFPESVLSTYSHFAQVIIINKNYLHNLMLIKNKSKFVADIIEVLVFTKLFKLSYNIFL